MLAHIVDSSVHEKLTETNWNSDHLSSPSSIASTFDYDVLDSIKSELAGSTQDNLMFTDEINWSDAHDVEIFQQESKEPEVIQSEADVHTRSATALLSNRNLTPPLSRAAEDNFISSHVGGYEMYDAPLSSSVPPTTASEALFQQSGSSKPESHLLFQTERPVFANYRQSDYNVNDKVRLEQQANCEDNNLSKLSTTTTTITSQITSNFQLSRHFTPTSISDATSTLSAPTSSTITAISENTGKSS